jgi:hypothetical protein
MTCPLFIDFTRECVSKFPTLVNLASYNICESDNYDNCPFYQAINSDFLCKYLNKCIYSYMHNIPSLVKKIFNEEKAYKLIQPLWAKYCFSKLNCNKCERYKKYDCGELPSNRLFPDGKSHYLDIIIGREITIK